MAVIDPNLSPAIDFHSRGVDGRIVASGRFDLVDFHGHNGCSYLMPVDKSVTNPAEVIRQNILKRGGALHVSNFFSDAFGAQARLDRVINHVTEAGWNTFFLCSGSEANEAAIKAAFLITEGEGRRRIVGLGGSYFGRTIAETQMYGNIMANGTYSSYLPVIPGFESFDNKEELLHYADSEQVAAVMLELMPSKNPAPIDPEFIKELNRIRHKRGTIIIVDELKTGCMRPADGGFIGSETVGLQADIVTVGKALAGGFPLSAVLVSPTLSKKIATPRWYSTTTGGNPILCELAADLIASRMNTPRRLSLEHMLDKAEMPGSWQVAVLGDYAIFYGGGNSFLVAERLKARGLLVYCSSQNSFSMMPGSYLSTETVRRGIDITIDVLREMEAE